MITIKTFICAEAIVQDLVSRQLSVFNMFEHLSAVSFPIFLPRLSLCAIAFWDGEGDKIAAGTLEVYNNEAKLIESPVSLDFTGSPRHRLMWSFQGFVLPSPGALKFVLLIGGSEAARYELTAELVTPPTVSQLGGPRNDRPGDQAKVGSGGDDKAGPTTETPAKSQAVAATDARS